MPLFNYIGGEGYGQNAFLFYSISPTGTTSSERGTSALTTARNTAKAGVVSSRRACCCLVEHRARVDCAGPGHLGGQEIDAF